LEVLLKKVINSDSLYLDNLIHFELLHGWKYCLRRS
jgi:hypothetical protein